MSLLPSHLLLAHLKLPVSFFFFFFWIILFPGTIKSSSISPYMDLRRPHLSSYLPIPTPIIETAEGKPSHKRVVTNPSRWFHLGFQYYFLWVPALLPFLLSTMVTANIHHLFVFPIMCPINISNSKLSSPPQLIHSWLQLWFSHNLRHSKSQWQLGRLSWVSNMQT